MKINVIVTVIIIPISENDMEKMADGLKQLIQLFLFLAMKYTSFSNLLSRF